MINAENTFPYRKLFLPNFPPKNITIKVVIHDALRKNIENVHTTLKEIWK